MLLNNCFDGDADACSQNDSLHLVYDVRVRGYPNVYGAHIRVLSCWNFEYLNTMLVEYPDREIIEFLKYGWPANRLPNMPPPTINWENHASAVNFPQAVESYLQNEINEGAVMGPFHSIPFDNGLVGVSPLSTRAKKDSSERRIILDLSYPEGYSVNDWTPKDTYLGMHVDLKYPGADDLAIRVYKLGTHCRMYKRDASRCFRWIPLNPHDYQLFGYVWNGFLYFDRVLAMGHHIAPYICQRVTSALAYIQHKSGNECRMLTTFYIMSL